MTTLRDVLDPHGSIARVEFTLTAEDESDQRCLHVLIRQIPYALARHMPNVLFENGGAAFERQSRAVLFHVFLHFFFEAFGA